MPRRPGAAASSSSRTRRGDRASALRSCTSHLLRRSGGRRRPPTAAAWSRPHRRRRQRRRRVRQCLPLTAQRPWSGPVAMTQPPLFNSGTNEMQSFFQSLHSIGLVLRLVRFGEEFIALRLTKTYSKFFYDRALLVRSVRCTSR